MGLNRNEKEICQKILAVAQSLYQKNMLAGADGNISVRVAEEFILMTPSGVSKARMDINQMAIVDSQGKVLWGTASSETQMHIAVYQSCSKARAVVHAHPPTAIAWTIARPQDEFLPSECMSELILATGQIPIVPFARPGTKEMGQALKKFLPENRNLILARHGALSWGESLEEAHRGMERLEHSACILKSALQLGGLSRLPEEELEYLRQQRKQMSGESL